MSHSQPLMNPTGGDGLRRGRMQPALHDELMARVLDPVNLRRAWKRVKANRGAPGCDGMRIEDFPEFARSQWTEIRQQLNDGRYQPEPVRRVSIPKPGGGERLLGMPTVVDRVSQQAMAQVLMPIFDSGFSESRLRIPSLGFVLRTRLRLSKIVPDDFVGFRPGRSAHGALRQVQAHLEAGYRIAVDLDLAKFFDHVQHDVLLARVARKLGDKRLLALIGRYLRAGVLVGESIQATELGTPQGGPLSPLLTNILLEDIWTRNWKGVATDSSAMRTTW
ncbi:MULTISPECIES: reverse transcriptase domain-containing protein [Methylococcus]|uniref:Reverse transcriptase domain-containing protein n=1 Tax=Methylococcus capsulatus TaxID=414 RepID=A0ABZ2F5E5_METCP|nr:MULTISPECIES: reverse transcriptase domain-containing protein [Methylococcus]